MSETTSQNGRLGAHLSGKRREPAARIPVKTAVTLTASTHDRLRAASLALGKTQSELVEALVRRHYAGYGLRRPGESAEEPEPLEG